MSTAADFTSFSRQELIDLCRERNVAGHSHKKIHELIDLLVKAGIPAEKPNGTKKSTKTVPVQAPTSVPVAPATTVTQPVTPAAVAPAPPVTLHTYIFNTEWPNVLPYLDTESVAVILADTASNALGDRWITECIRVLEPTGTFLIRGLPRIPQTIPKTLHTTWLTCEKQERILAIRKDAPYTTESKRIEDIYVGAVGAAATHATVLLPFADDGTLCRIVKKYEKSLIAMDKDPDSIQTLYTILAGK